MHNIESFHLILFSFLIAYHLFLLTIGLVIMIAADNATIVITSCILLKFSLSTSNVWLGATRVENKSRPYANISEVDSNRAGDVITPCTLITL